MREPNLKRVAVLAARAIAFLWIPCANAVGPADNGSEVRCLLQSASLHFGRLGLHRPPLVAGEGEVVVACQNTATVLRRVEVSLAFPTMGPQTGFLRSSHGSLAVGFYQDAQFGVRWGEDRKGLTALQIPLELGAGERKLLRLPVYALLQNPRDAVAGVYAANIPVTIATAPP